MTEFKRRDDHSYAARESRKVGRRRTRLEKDGRDGRSDISQEALRIADSAATALTAAPGRYAHAVLVL